MGRRRAGLNIEVDEQPVDIEDFAGKGSINEKPLVDRVKVQEVAEASGFVSRQPKKRRKKKRSPYVVQTNLKTRLGMKELLQTLSDTLDINDQETLELAILALLEKEGFKNLIKEYKELTK